MPSLRRCFALLSFLSLLQLTLLGSGTVCAMRGDGTSHGQMSSAGMAAMSGHSAQARCDVSGTGDDCGAPWSGAQCAGMATCAPTVVKPAAVAMVTTAPHHVLDLPEPASITSSAATSPELPPPRA